MPTSVNGLCDIEPGQLGMGELKSDADVGRNALVSCRLADSADSDPAVKSQMFKLVPRPFQHLQAEADYQLMTSQGSADRETRWRYNVTVECSDDGSPRSLTSYKSLSVYVTDRNDNAPTFTSQVYVYTTSRDVTSPERRSQ